MQRYADVSSKYRPFVPRFNAALSRPSPKGKEVEYTVDSQSLGDMTLTKTPQGQR
jgi:hypothetical protein